MWRLFLCLYLQIFSLNWNHIFDTNEEEVEAQKIFILNKFQVPDEAQILHNMQRLLIKIFVCGFRCDFQILHYFRVFDKVMTNQIKSEPGISGL